MYPDSKSELASLKAVALTGPPNSGKTTLYNWITGSRYGVVNYPGSTVEFHRGESLKQYGQNLTVIDTPGIRSLVPRSKDEELALKVIRGELKGLRPDALVVVVDASQLSRHLPLVFQLKESGHSFVLAVTMIDILKSKGFEFNRDKLEQRLGVPVVSVDGRLGGGVKETLDRLKELSSVASDSSSVSNLPLKKTSDRIRSAQEIFPEVDQIVGEVLASRDLAPGKEAELSRAHPRTLSFDRWLLHPQLGLFFFLAIMTILFTGIFWAAVPFMDLIDSGFAYAAELGREILGNGLLARLLSDGLLTSVGGVLVFVPQIFILFIGLSILEESGYLARAASLVDRPLSALGLGGRSFVPLLSGYACAIPAMMAARNISSARERTIALMVIPLLSCSARLPVYALLLALLIGSDPLLAGFGLATLYFCSFFVSAIAAHVANMLLPHGSKSRLLLELPALRRPRFRIVLKNASLRTKSFVYKAGPAIVVVGTLIWVMTTFPNYDQEDASIRLEQSFAAQAGRLMEPVFHPMGVDWRVGVGMISAFAAREVFVSTLAVLFRVSEEKEDSLLSAVREAQFSDGRPIFTYASVIGLIFFFMVALQCLSTWAVARKESGSSRFAFLQLLVFNVIAYVGAVIIYQALS